MPIKCRHLDGTTHGVHIFDGDVICDVCERVFDPEMEATPLQVHQARADDVDVAYQASVSDLVWLLYLDDPTKPHDRQTPRNSPWLFPPSSKISAPESGCPPCYAESAQVPGASNNVSASSGSHEAAVSLEAIPEEEGEGDEEGEGEEHAEEDGEEDEEEEGEEDEEEDGAWGPWAAVTTGERLYAELLALNPPHTEQHANQSWIQQQADARLRAAEEDRTQEATDEGAPESRETQTSFYLSL